MVSVSACDSRGLRFLSRRGQNILNFAFVQTSSHNLIWDCYCNMKLERTSLQKNPQGKTQGGGCAKTSMCQLNVITLVLPLALYLSNIYAMEMSQSWSGDVTLRGGFEI